MNMSEDTVSDEEVIILTGEGCPPCEEIKEVLKGAKTKTKYRFVDVNTDEGRAIVEGGVENLELPFALRVKKSIQIEQLELFRDHDTVLLQDSKGKITPLKE